MRRITVMNGNGTGLRCASCRAPLHRGRDEVFFVEIRAVSDPAPVEFTEEDLERDTRLAIDDLLKQVRSLTEEELLLQVYARRLYALCPACHRGWLDDPFGASRRSRT